VNRLVRALVNAAVFLSLTQAVVGQAEVPAGKKQLTIESIFAEGGITGRGPEEIKWSPDNNKFTFIQRDDTGEHGALWYMDVMTGEKKVLVPEIKLQALAPPLAAIKSEREKERISRYHVAAYQWSRDSKYLLFGPSGQLWLYNIENGTAIQFASNTEPSLDPKFSPDGGRVAYVRDHNLYVRPVSGGNERQLTRGKDQKKGKETDQEKDDNLLNGEVDWLYAEELSVRSNYFWSPKGDDLLFLQMNESRVPTYPITDWLPGHAQLDEEKYPQAGDPNPEVRLGIVSASGGKVKWISLADDSNIYIPRFGWIREGWVWAEVLNRAQDRLDLYFVDVKSGKSRQVLNENDPEGWVNVNDDFQILKSGDRFLWTSWRDGNTHIYLYSFDQANPLGGDAKLERQLTKGNFEVLGVETVDDASGKIYFSCNKDDPRQKQLYSVNLDGSGMTRISQEEGTHDPKFAGNAKYYIDAFSATLQPPKLSLCETNARCRDVWDSRAVNDFELIPPKFLEFKADDSTTLYGQLLLPPAGTTDDRIPLLIYVYGGPAGQVVKNAWGGTTFLFHELLAKNGFAVFSVDNRGTPNRDRKFQTAIRHQFGAIELKDQLDSIDQLLPQVPQLDRSRIGIWGWSNGGSMTLYSLTHSDMFKAGVSVAPVTDWHLYDSAYTERYMGLPKQNSRAYEESTMPNSADKLHGDLLLVHGTSDDNVHFQNSIQMIEGLVKAGKRFRFMAYPGKTHGIGGAEDRDHLFHMIQDHFQRELMKNAPAQPR
jgi:dipeptidyl-peptidase-4